MMSDAEARQLLGIEADRLPVPDLVQDLHTVNTKPALAKTTKPTGSIASDQPSQSPS